MNYRIALCLIGIQTLSFAAGTVHTTAESAASSNLTAGTTSTTSFRSKLIRPTHPGPEKKATIKEVPHCYPYLLGCDLMYHDANIPIGTMTQKETLLEVNQQYGCSLTPYYYAATPSSVQQYLNNSCNTHFPKRCKEHCTGNIVRHFGPIHD